jgi:hypothetical protein
VLTSETVVASVVVRVVPTVSLQPVSAHVVIAVVAVVLVVAVVVEPVSSPLPTSDSEKHASTPSKGHAAIQRMPRA